MRSNEGPYVSSPLSSSKSTSRGPSNNRSPSSQKPESQDSATADATDSLGTSNPGTGSRPNSSPVENVHDPDFRTPDNEQTPSSGKQKSQARDDASPSASIEAPPDARSSPDFLLLSDDLSKPQLFQTNLNETTLPSLTTAILDGYQRININGKATIAERHGGQVDGSLCSIADGDSRIMRNLKLLPQKKSFLPSPPSHIRNTSSHQMATEKPDSNSAALQGTTSVFGTLSLDNEKPKSHQSNPQLDSDGEEEPEETDAQQGQERAEIDKAGNEAKENSNQAFLLPFILFVYGPLADPFFLTYTMKMGKNPELTRSSISGYRMKFSKRYPAPIPAHGKTISEFSIPIQNETQLRKITKWYAAAYKLVECKIAIMRNEGQDYAPSTKDWVPPRWVRDRFVDGKVFVWAGDADSEELREGYWDEGWWEMERDAIMGIKKTTNTRELERWEVKQRNRLDVWKEEREAEKQRLSRSQFTNTRRLDSRSGAERTRDELGGLD